MGGAFLIVMTPNTVKHWRRVGATLALSLSALGAWAGQSSAPFGVTVNLISGAVTPTTGLCVSKGGAGSFGATVTVVCSTGVLVDLGPSQLGQPWIPTHGGAYRYVTQVSNGTGLLGTVDIYSEFGTVTAWRVMLNADREYLEMTVGW